MENQAIRQRDRSGPKILIKGQAEEVRYFTNQEKENSLKYNTASSENQDYYSSQMTAGRSSSQPNRAYSKETSQDRLKRDKSNRVMNVLSNITNQLESNNLKDSLEVTDPKLFLRKKKEGGINLDMNKVENYASLGSPINRKSPENVFSSKYALFSNAGISHRHGRSNSLCAGDMRTDTLRDDIKNGDRKLEEEFIRRNVFERTSSTIGFLKSSRENFALDFSKIIAEKDEIITKMSEEKIQLAEKILSFEKNQVNLIRENQGIKQMNAELAMENQRLFEELSYFRDNFKGIEVMQSHYNLHLEKIAHLESENRDLQTKYSDLLDQYQREIETLREENEYLKYVQEKVLTNCEKSNIQDEIVSPKKEEPRNRPNILENSRIIPLGRSHNRSSNKTLPPLKESDLTTSHLITTEKENGDKFRESGKFIEKLQGLVLELSPPQSFRGQPNLRDIWKWLQTLLTEYMHIKKSIENTDNEEVLAQTMNLLKVSHPKEIQSEIIKLITRFKKNDLLDSGSARSVKKTNRSFHQ